jgi:glutathione S-transferase
MSPGILLIETTRGCGRTPSLLVLLEELAAPYEVQVRPDGYFLSTYGRPGPRLVDAEVTLFEVSAMLRYCALTRAGGRWMPRSPAQLARLDAWLEIAGFLGLCVVGLMREEREQGAARRPERIREERAKIASILQGVEFGLDDSDGDWLLGEFGLADCALSSLPRLESAVDFGAWPRVRAYCARLMRRPSMRVAQAFGCSAGAARCEVSSGSNP